MKIKHFLHPLTTALLCFLLSFGGIGCLSTAFGLELSLSVLAQCCALCAVIGCALFSLRNGGIMILCALVPVGGYLWLKTDFWSQVLRLSYDISHIYAMAYGIGWFGSLFAADSVALPLYVWGGLTALTAGWCLSRGRFAAIALSVSLVPLALCLVVTNTVPAEKYLFLLLLGMILVLLTQSIRRNDPCHAAKLCWYLAIPAVLALAVLFLSSPQTGYDKQPQTEKIEKTVMQWIDRIPYVQTRDDGTITLSFARQIPDTVDLQTAGPNTQVAIRVMEVTAETDGTLYLRGRDYDDYTGTQWNSTENRTEAFTFLQTGRFPDISFNGTLTIRTFGARSIRYFPYYPVPSCTLADGACDNPDEETAYVYQWRALPGGFEPAISDPEVVQTQAAASDAIPYNYYTYPPAPDAIYLRLPDTTREWAEAYLAEHLSADPADSICATANAIAALVRQSATYDLNTPRMPGEQADFARWFLEESDTGYCVHYATATTVLLRAAGINARYVEGYMTEVTAGKTVTVTEKDAHAWAEYYVPGVGWIPLESTAAVAAVEGESTTPGTAAQAQPSEEAAPAPSAVTEETAASTGAATPSRDPSSEPPSEPVAPPVPQEPPATVAVLPTVTVLLVLLAVLTGQYPLRLQLRRHYLNTGSANARAIKKWQYACLLARLQHQSPPPELEELALRARFSQHILTEDDLAAFDCFCGDAALQLRRCPWWLRLYHCLFWAAY